MSVWIRTDHPLLAERQLSATALGLWTQSLFAADQDSDDTAWVSSAWVADQPVVEEVVQELVSAGLWEPWEPDGRLYGFTIGRRDDLWTTDQDVAAGQVLGAANA